jgi:hypothetical protein
MLWIVHAVTGPLGPSLVPYLTVMEPTDGATAPLEGASVVDALGRSAPRQSFRS